MTTRMLIFMGLFLSLTTALYADGPQKSTAARSAVSAAEAAAAVRNYRVSHQYAIIREFTDFLAIPNIASDAPNIARNAERLTQMLEARGIR
ncbi:MAG TPA: hypothetical protein VJX29_08140, partial [Candidatus Acidoferrales bacterium]|nr:hypothetical protein [Candidatus Acidoferrales bacterium]